MTVEGVEQQILKQVEFYFGDANLPRDKFLLERVQENEGGWVPVDTIASFSRMKKMSEDAEIIKAAISVPSEVIELNEDSTLVRRKTPLPQSQETLTKTVYVKGFPMDASLDELQAFFAQHSEQVQAIRMRRIPKDHVFKGSVFVEFTSEEEAARFTQLNLTYNDKSLMIKTKMAYFQEKNDEKTNKTAKKTMAILDRMGRNRLVKILDFPAEGITHEQLKESLKDTFAVAYVDFSYEAGCAWIRFKESIADNFVAEFNNEKPLEIGEHKFTSFQVATEEEQIKYYDASFSQRTDIRRDAPRRGVPRRDNKRSADRNEESESDAKAAKVEESTPIVEEVSTPVAAVEVSAE